MKKGSQLSETLYFLEIKDLYNKPVTLVTARSLRDAVNYASEFVLNMDNYQKVNRQFREMDGAFVGVYFTRKPNEQPRFTTHLIVLIHSSKAAENQTVLQKMEQVNEVFGTRMREENGNLGDSSLENFKRY